MSQMIRRRSIYELCSQETQRRSQRNLNRSRSRYLVSTIDSCLCLTRRLPNVYQLEAYGIMPSSSSPTSSQNHPRPIRCHQQRTLSCRRSSTRTSRRVTFDRRNRPCPVRSSLSKRRMVSCVPYRTIESSTLEPSRTRTLFPSFLNSSTSSKALRSSPRSIYAGATTTCASSKEMSGKQRSRQIEGCSNQR